MDDARAVMDAVGSSRAAFYRSVRGGADEHSLRRDLPGAHRGARRPQRLPRRMWAPDYPWGQTEEAYERDVETRTPGLRPTRAGRESESSSDSSPTRRTLPRFLRLEPRRARRAPPDEQGDRHPACPARPFGFRRCLHGAEDRTSRSRSPATSPRVFPVRASSRSRASVTSLLAQAKPSAKRSNVRGGGVGGRRLGGSRARPRSGDRPLHGHRRLDRGGSRARGPKLAGATRASPRAHSPRARPLSRRGARRRRRRLLRAVRRPGARDPLRLCDHRQRSRSSG